MNISKEEKLSELLTLQEAASLLKCHQNTLRTWDRSGIFKAIRLGPRKLVRYKIQDIEQLINIHSHDSTSILPNNKFPTIKKFLTEHADSIQKQATREHKKFLGGGLLRSEIIPKYQKMHILAVQEFSRHLDDEGKGIIHIKKLGRKIADAAIKDDLTIKEAVDGIIFLKQGVWKSLKKEKLLDYLPPYDLYQLNMTIGTYCDVIGTQIAFIYHDAAMEKKDDAEENLRLILDNVQDFAIMKLDSRGNVTYWNNGAERLLRYTKKDILGKNYSLFFAKEEQETKKPKRELQSAITKGSVENENWSVRKDGSKFWASGATTSIPDPSGKKHSFIKIIRDRTELKEVERQKDEFVSIISHELKNPLTSMLAFTQLLQKRLENSNDQMTIKAITSIKTQTDKLTDLVRNLLEQSKVRSRSFLFFDNFFDLDTVIYQTIDELQTSKATHKIIFKNISGVRIKADKAKIGQVLYNLISNAIKYSPDANKVIVSTLKKEETVTVSIQDFGMGICQENIDKLFTPFFRASDTQRETFPSIGLGLYISAEIIKHYEGKIWVESTEGKGSIFSFTLPLNSKDDKDE